MEEKLVKRSQKVAFYGVPGEDSATYHRMTGFTEFSKTSNPKEYNRQYVDEDFERNDITGYNPEFSYAFDLFENNAVHTDIAMRCTPILRKSRTKKRQVRMQFAKSLS